MAPAQQPSQRPEDTPLLHCTCFEVTCPLGGIGLSISERVCLFFLPLSLSSPIPLKWVEAVCLQASDLAAAQSPTMVICIYRQY